MTTYVLVGGGWLGGWCWQKVARQLREEDHDVYPATLTGLAERVHLASPKVDLNTHITDVVNLIEFEDLHDVVLLGHRATQGLWSRAQRTASPSASAILCTWTLRRSPTAVCSSRSSRPNS